MGNNPVFNDNLAKTELIYLLSRSITRLDSEKPCQKWQTNKLSRSFISRNLIATVFGIKGSDAGSKASICVLHSSCAVQQTSSTKMAFKVQIRTCCPHHLWIICSLINPISCLCSRLLPSSPSLLSSTPEFYQLTVLDPL